MRYLVVDDHSLIRDAMRSVLLSIDEAAEVKVAGSASEARIVLQREPPFDLALLDLNLPDAQGLSLLEELRQRFPTMAVAMLSGDRDASIMRKALDAGASGYLPKTESRAVLSSALALILSGGVYVPRDALGATAFVGSAQTPPAGQPTPLSLGLTERQVEVLALIMKGRTNKHICRQLNLAEPTVKNHVTAILRALKVTSRTEAVIAVTSMGWNLNPDRK